VHARSLDVCLVHHEGARLLHRPLPAAPAPFLQAVAPSRDRVVVAVACLFPWDGLAALWAAAGSACVLGHALSRPARPGGQATNAQRDAQPRAALRRGGLLPQAEGSPAARRAPRARCRRRPPRRRHRAARLAPGPPTPRPEHGPAMGQTRAAQAHRAGGAARVDEAAGPPTSAGGLALLPSEEERRRALDRSRLTTAPPPEAHPRSRGPTGPGRGTLLRLGLRSARQALARCPRGQAGAASARLLQGAPASAGQRGGPAGTPRGPALRPWAWAAAAVVG
jgi:hypothetical protein